MDLFSSAAEEQLRSRGPLAARLRPRSIDEVIGQEHLLGHDKPLRRLIDADRLHSLILWGPPGTGKTSIALAIAGSTSAHFDQLSAVTAGVKDVREVIDRARERLGSHGQRTILFLDEIHRFSKSQQDALLPAVEDGSVLLIGATTENPYFQVNGALLSRSVLFRLESLGAEDVRRVVERGASALNVAVADGAVDEIIRRCAGDARQALVLLDVAAALAGAQHVTVEDVERAIGSTALRYGVDDHYDVVSAFIKSMRGSDPQATVLYLARMITSGEDPRFIARRMVIFASEDIGAADPGSLQIAVTAAQALDIVGLPEAQLNLAQAAIHLALAPKDNAIAQAIWTARRDLEAGLKIEVPSRLRDAHYAAASELGHGAEYVNPHSGEGPSGDGSHLPDELKERRWYLPKNAGSQTAPGSRMGEGNAARPEAEEMDQ